MHKLNTDECNAIRQAFFDVTQSGQHLSSAIDLLFRKIDPLEDQASAIRSALFNAVRFNDVEGAISGEYDVAKPSALHIPNWLQQRLRTSLQDKYEQFVSESCKDAPTFIRLNTIKTTTLSLTNYHTTTLANCFQVPPFSLFRTPDFAKGFFEQQDINSQRVSLSLEAKPGMRVVDACAGTGGKTLHLAALMQNKGTIIALDIHADKLETLRKRAARAGANVIEARHITSTKTVKRLHESADRVLIDAPCTGTGVLRRNPDILWHLQEKTLIELQTLQQAILQRNALIAKPGGLVVFATCSVLNEEGEDQVRIFLENNSSFVLIDEWRTLPGDEDGDGFYCAVLRRSAHA